MIFVIFLLFFMPLTGLAGTFVKVQELKNTFKYGVLQISASEDGRYAFIEDGNQVFWLMNSIQPLTLHNIFDDKQNSPPFEKKPVKAQWHDKYIIFLYYEKTEFYNVQNQKIERHYPLRLTKFNGQMLWSEKHQRFIIDTKVFTLDSDIEKNPDQHGHADQTGLLMTKNGDDYITSGRHDQSIMRWTLPDGKLKKTWRLGKWYASRKVSDIALIDNQLVVATNNGEIHARSIDDGSVLWSASPCSSFFSSESPHFMLNGSVRLKNKSVHHNKLIFYRCQSTKPNYGFIEKQGNDWKLEKITLPSTGNASLERMYYLDSLNKAILGLDDGQVLLYDLKNKNIDQIIVPKSEEGNGPALFAYLKADKLLVVVNDKTVDIYQYQ
ncbi:MAG: hypothetical protein L3K25_19815 [Gammaproteobacteria bacterium]|nr:hypothetical protein [Gammaproteobacteria bacterium]